MEFDSPRLGMAGHMTWDLMVQKVADQIEELQREADEGDLYAAMGLDQRIQGIKWLWKFLEDEGMALESLDLELSLRQEPDREGAK